ncbi:hypothetical protein CKO09_04335 [Chromatium weissei]|nr:hypothetical protein [Chromatium weissei]
MNHTQQLADKQRFWLSNLQDGALNRNELPQLLNAVAEDATLRHTWERYQLIGQIIRGESYDPMARQVAQRVQMALATAPVVALPRRMRPLPMPIVRFAIAASVVGIAAFIAPAVLKNSTLSDSDSAEIAPELTATAAVFGGRWHLDQPHLVNKLDRFLVTHQETAPISETKGMLRYATFVREDFDR